MSWWNHHQIKINTGHTVSSSSLKVLSNSTCWNGCQLNRVLQNSTNLVNLPRMSWFTFSQKTQNASAVKCNKKWSPLPVTMIFIYFLIKHISRFVSYCHWSVPDQLSTPDFTGDTSYQCLIFIYIYIYIYIHLNAVNTNPGLLNHWTQRQEAYRKK